MRKWISGLLLIASVALCFSACAQTPPESELSDGSPSAEDDEPMLMISEGGKTEYQLVCPEQLLDSNQMMQIMMALESRFEGKTGAKLSILSDEEAEPREKEILLGSVRGRAESEAAMAKISAPDKKGYRVSVVGEKVLISCEDARLLGNAVGLFLDGLVEVTEGSFGLPQNFSASMDLPSVASADQVPVVCYTGEENYTATYTDVNYMVYREYLTTLEKDGFTQYTSNHFGRTYFATYIKESPLGSMVAHVMFFEKLYRLEITYGLNDEFLPPVETMSTGSTGKVTPTITQPARKGSTSEAPGMSAIIQLSDASFVIFDGGPYDMEDEMALYNYMKERTPEGQKPVIAAWIITHAHGDHMGLALSFLTNYRKLVTLKLGAFNFPDFNSITIQNESASSMGGMASTFKTTVESYPDAQCWVMHTGQVLKLPDCEIRVLYTPEDAGSTKFPWGNHTCTALRVTVNDTTFTVLGDAEKTLCQQMADAYGSSLKSDVLSLSHHGFNGACLDLYKNVNPDICFWPVDSARFNEDPRCTGVQGGYNFNAWIRNETVKVREHYTADETATIEC